MIEPIRPYAVVARYERETHRLIEIAVMTSRQGEEIARSGVIPAGTYVSVTMGLSLTEAGRLKDFLTPTYPPYSLAREYHVPPT